MSSPFPPSPGTPDRSLSEQQQEPTQDGDSGHINLTIRDPQGEEVYFKVRKTTKMKKLFHAFCKRGNSDPNTIRFFYQGDRINDDDTPEDLNLHEGAKIDAFVRQVAGCI